MKLGVNIDHVATLRNARGGNHPSPLKAAKIIETCGADLIVVHLREDRRHIKEKDIEYLLRNISIPLQLEIAPNEFMFDFAIKNNIKKVCIVPEKRKELTTEGGLDLNANRKFLENNLQKLYSNEIEVSLFLDPIKENIHILDGIGIDKIELHTGEFANADNQEEQSKLKSIGEIIELANKKKIYVAAGHGLTFEKVKKIVFLEGIEELNIGHFIIGESIFYGLENVVNKMLNLIKDRN